MKIKDKWIAEAKINNEDYNFIYTKKKKNNDFKVYKFFSWFNLVLFSN